MTFIPSVPEPYPDELLIGYICRTADQNGMDPAQFRAYYLGHDRNNKRPIKTDLGYDFVRFYENAFLDMDMLDLYQSTSTFSFESISMSGGRQKRYISSVFSPEGPLNVNMVSIYEPMKICPECAKRDAEEYGRAYMHRSHQLSGMCVCPEHGCRLMQYKGKAGHEYKCDMNDYEEMNVDVPMDDAVYYANYAENVLAAGISSDAVQLKTAVVNKIKNGQRLMRADYDTFVDKISKWEHAALVRDIDIGRKFKTKLTSATGMSMREAIPVLMYLYPDVKDLKSALQKDEPVMAEYTCPDCGRVYISSPELQKDGWGCPYCGASEPIQERFEKLVQTAGNGQYEPLEPFESLRTKMRFRCGKCGEEIAMKPGRFLFDGVKCTCEHQITRQKARKIVESHPGFRLKKFTKASENAVIYHEDCGQEFECIFSNFMKTPICHICNNNSRQNTDRLKHQIEELVGDEYSMESEYVDPETKIAIRHNVCGHVHEYRPDAFLGGQRCPDCQETVSRNELKSMLAAYSDGRYVLKDMEHGSCVIEDIETEQTLSIPVAKVLQEMRRPTPSSVLPVDETREWEFPPSEWDKVYELFILYKEETGLSRIPDRDSYKGVRLGEWCRLQRIHRRNGTLSQEKIRKLDAVGFKWDLSRDAIWEEKYRSLKRFIKKHGTSKMPRSKVYGGICLGRWCDKQREQYRNHKLSDERIQKLEEIGFELEKS